MMLFPDTSEQVPNPSNTEDKKKFTRIGCGLLLAFLLTVGLQLLILFLAGKYGVSEMTGYLLVDLAMSLLAFPAGAFLIRRAGRSTAPAGTRKGFAVWLSLLALATEFGIAGQLIGSFFSAPAEGEGGFSPAGVGEALLYVAVIGFLEPICEELFFRQCLTGTLRQWGWKAAVLLGALFYALYHASLGQFFMALGMGAVLSYAYLTTGKIRVPIFIHVFINLFFQVIPVLSQTYLCSAETLTKLEEAIVLWSQSGYREYTQIMEILTADRGAAAGLMTENLIGILELGLSLAGAVILFTMSRKAVMQPGERKLERRSVGDTVFLAPGIAAFVLACVVVLVISLSA